MIELNDIKKRYDEPWRSYHTIRHVNEVKILGRELVKERKIKVDPQVINMFALFHDCVYIPGGKDNEKLSAEMWMHYALEHRVREEIASTVNDLILLTKTPGAARTPLQIAMMDADWHMMIQPVTHGWLKEYEQGIRTEYALIPVGQYMEGRLRFIAESVEGRLMHKDNAEYLRSLLKANYDDTAEEQESGHGTPGRSGATKTELRFMLRKAEMERDTALKEIERLNERLHDYEPAPAVSTSLRSVIAANRWVLNRTYAGVWEATADKLIPVDAPELEGYGTQYVKGCIKLRFGSREDAIEKLGDSLLYDCMERTASTPFCLHDDPPCIVTKGDMGDR